MSYYIRQDGTVGGGMQNPLERQKELEKMQGGGKRSEPNMVMETKQEVIDTIAKKDYSKQSLIQNTGIGTPRNMLFVIKKGDPIQVIKTTNVGTLQTDVFYDLKKHKGQNYAMTIEEENKLAIKRPFGFTGNFGFFSEYNLPKDVVEEPTIVETTKELLSPNSKSTSSLFKIVLLGVVGYVIYKVVKK
jgi:hypothetical protein